MPATLQLCREQLAAHMAAAGMTRQKDLAEAMGMSEPSIYRTVEERYELSGRTIARLLAALPSATFDDLFSVVDEAPKRPKAPFSSLLKTAISTRLVEVAA